MRAKLSDVVAKKAQAGLYWDLDDRSPSGFALRVTPAGARAWIFNYRVRATGRERRITIGDVASWSVVEARKKAGDLRRIVDEGGDPLGQLEEHRAAPTVADLIERFIKDALPRRQPRTQAEYKAM